MKGVAVFLNGSLEIQMTVSRDPVISSVLKRTKRLVVPGQDGYVFRKGRV